MKVFLLVFFLITGCSTTRFYKAADVVVELKKNSQQLQLITYNVDRDYTDKQAFYKEYEKNSKDKENFIVQDLAWRLHDLKLKRDSVLNKSAALREVNDKLLKHVETKDHIKESDSIFKRIDSFSSSTGKEAGKLFNEYASYKDASTEFARFALFTGNIFKKSSSVRR